MSLLEAKACETENYGSMYGKHVRPQPYIYVTHVSILLVEFFFSRVKGRDG